MPYLHRHHTGLEFRGSSEGHGLLDGPHSFPDKLVDFRAAQCRVVVDEQPTGDRVRAYFTETRQFAKSCLQEFGDTRPAQHHPNVPTLAPWNDGPRS
ncbi:MAG: hypothetical protein ACRDSF_16250 [Pseudonocardiaceae bacterium]